MATLEKQIETARAIFSGVEHDKDGYRGCPTCGSRKLIHDGHALDHGYIRCLDCGRSLEGADPYDIVYRWNCLHRESFQLELPFEKT